MEPVFVRRRSLSSARGPGFKRSTRARRFTAVMQIVINEKDTDRNPGKPDFFRLSFRNCISCVNDCEDLLYTYLENTELDLLSE